MRRYLLGMLLLLGCSGENVVAGEGKTKAEQLEASLPSWCQSACQRLSVCDGQGDCTCTGDLCECTGTIDDGCPADCQAEMSRFSQGSDECAAIGQRYQNCIDDNGCDVVTVSGVCSLTEQEQAACPGRDGEDTQDYGSSSGTAGSANIGVSPTTNNPLVHCVESYGTGGGMPASGGAYVICEEGMLECTDGHDYRLICVTTSEGRSSCSCFVDEQVTGAFDPGGICPSTPQVNAGCGWYIVEEL